LTTWAVLALERQTGVLIALALLAVAAGVVSWMAFARLRRHREAEEADPR
jgi:hypothetical protein